MQPSRPSTSPTSPDGDPSVAVATAVATALESGASVGRREEPDSGGATASHGHTKTARVSIVIPVYNQAELTEKCLYAVAANTGENPDYEVVVVDNGSTDWTMYLMHAMEGDIQVISNDRNLGFARACNQGAEQAHGEFLLFLNNDTVAMEECWLRAMVALADSDSSVGVVGAKLLYPGTGKVQHAGLTMRGDIPEHLYRGVDQNDHRVLEERDLDMVTGACLLIRRDLFHQLGGFDTQFINGVEDVDLCLRVRELGKRVVYCPDAVLEHHEGSTEGRFDRVSDNLRRFKEKWGGRFDDDGEFIVATADDPGVIPPDFSEPAAAAGTAEEVRSASATATGPSDADLVRGNWEGDFFVHSSLAHVNRELVRALLATGRCELGLRHLQTAQFGPEEDDFARFPAVAARLNQFYRGDEADFHLKHRWPPDFNRPVDSRFILLQPWEFGRIPETWVEPLRKNVDQVWAPTSYVRDCYVDSGVDPAKVALVPQGVDPSRFRPGVSPLTLPTEKSFKFLFVGGTLYRKGIDLLLDAYCQTFSREDDVCLVIKDLGMNTFYRGMNSSQRIGQLQADPSCPEIVYLTEEMSGGDMPRLYAAADALVHPYRGEGFGLPVAEAMACGLPVIVTRGGACDDFCPDELVYSVAAQKVEVSFQQATAGQAWLLEPDLDCLKRRMLQVVDNAGEGRRRGRRASEFIRSNFTWERAAWTAAEILEELKETRPLQRTGGRRKRGAMVVLGGSGGGVSQEVLAQCFGPYDRYHIDNPDESFGSQMNELQARLGGRDFFATFSGIQPPGADTANRILHHLDANDDVGMIVPGRAMPDGEATRDDLQNVSYPRADIPVFVRIHALQLVGGFDETFHTPAGLANLARTLRREGWRVVAASDCPWEHGSAPAAEGYCDELAAIQLLEDGDALRQAGDAAAAIESYRRALSLKNDFVEAILVLSDALVDVGEAGKAVDTIEQLVELEPRSAWAHNAAGLMLNRAANRTGALEHFRTAIELDPDFVDGHLNLGVLEWEAGEHEAALRALQEASRLDPANRELAINLSLIYSQIDQQDEAIALLEEYLRHHPDDVELMTQLADIMVQSRDEAGARAVAERILLQDPDNSRARALLDEAIG